MTLISNQHKGLVEFVKEKLPLVKHRQCARHEYANFKKVYNGIDYKRHFWAASMATIKSYFIGTMDELKEMNGSAYDHLMARNLESWSRAFFSEGRACKAVKNGISESFNYIIREARTKPLHTMLEKIGMYVMERFCRMSTKHLTFREDGKTKASQYVKGVHEGIHMDNKDEGMQDVMLVEDFKGDKHDRQLLASRYS
ncbi:unnamed protein product [Lactuca saligna]|uniref:Uncharacterized protein n=1 Tax=Lactuca saligna TaxID=75948 RepID=A0AA35YXA7_LACSI|nr:unnamed protein product [Lactuca saligna]